MPNLAEPTVLVRDSFVEAARDFRDESWLPDFPVEEAAADFGGYVHRVIAREHNRGVPVTTLWYTDGATYLGTVIVRHRLTPRTDSLRRAHRIPDCSPPPPAGTRHRHAGSGACLLP